MLTKKTVASAIATATLMLNSFATTAFATEIIISDNGASSNNTVNLLQNSTTNVVQTNNATVNNSVSSSASTGNNSANFNNGGDVTVNTGAASTTTNVSTDVNSNSANLGDCCPGGQSTNVLVSGNAALSNNTANIANNSSVNAFQVNNAKINNNVYSSSNSGGNNADFNNGGSVTINTGAASTNTTVKNLANQNMLKLGGGLGSGAGAGLSIRILDNAAFSNNTVNLAHKPSVLVVQDNNALVNNKVYSSAKTGDNSANFNNGGGGLFGGGVTINTGAASTNTLVDNMVNFNSANVDCGCILGNTLAKIDGNAFGSNNQINASLGGSLGIFQDNLAYLNNWVKSKAKTGNNNADFNNGGSSNQGDPSISTGPATENTTVRNNSNVDVVGPSLSSISLPGGGSLTLTLDLSSLSWLLPWWWM